MLMNDPHDHDSRAPWNDPEPRDMGYLEESDWHEEHSWDE